MRRTLKTLALLLAAGAVLPLWGGVAALFPPSPAPPAQRPKVDFVRDIRPIFQARCAGCHGAARQMAQLRLDNRQLALRVVAPGNGKDSRLLRRVLGLGGEPRMPKGGEPLPHSEIELIRRWIDEGADWPDSASAAVDGGQRHWAFIAPVRPAPPPVKNNALSRTPVDNFILAALERRGLAPSAEADKATLIRRLALDLTGLPPSLKEIDAFLADRSPDAYEKLVERLLASPHYGERWGRWWLDAARYADTNGFEKDRDRSIWPYRDWVIKAFNRDLPFDRFTVEQLAGDLLPQPTLEQRIATGFLRNSMMNEEGAVEPEQFRVERLIDRVDAVGKAFLGLTVNCAQCHTHKFDPVKHDEYYKFYAFFDSDEEPEIEVPSEEVKKKRAEILDGIAKIEDELLAKNPGLAERLAEWERRAAYDESQWRVLTDTEVIGTNGTKFERLLDDSYIGRGDNPTQSVYYVKARTDLKNITGFRLELMTDPTLPRGGPGRSTDGTVFVSEFKVEAAPAGQPDKAGQVAIAGASADYSSDRNTIGRAIDGDEKTSWSTDAGPGLRNQPRKAVFALKSPVGFDGGTLLTLSVWQKEFDGEAARRFEAPNAGRFRLSVTTAANPQADPVPAHVRRILGVPASGRTKEERREVFRYFRTTLPEFAEANKAAAALMRQWPDADTTLVLAPRPQPRVTRVFTRGDWKRPAEVVTPGTPAFLHPFPKDAPPNRLGLAQWIVHKDNPLTARVVVNRIWQSYFGQGLVTTPEDFGMRCEQPSHPELLDWLAVEFREKGWSWKHLHRLIVNSATYRQASRAPSPVRERLREADPSNRLLARAPRLRVEAETVRDITLAAAGLLSRKVGGPSVYPPIPDGALAVSFRSRSTWPTSAGEDRYRRGLYTFWKRSVPYPSMSVFDAPNADFACTRRARSTSPLQALTTLNDAAFVEAAQAMALRVWREGGADDRSRVVYAFRLATGRAPDAYEIQRLLALLRQQRARFAGDTAAAVYVTSPDPNNLPPGVDLHQLAPWTVVARVLLNLDETITKQ
jgi:mono/diheme cytochrome c family protein